MAMARVDMGGEYHWGLRERAVIRLRHLLAHLEELRRGSTTKTGLNFAIVALLPMRGSARPGAKR